MEEIKLQLDGNEGAFIVLENGEQLGEMVISIAEEKLTVYHTEVADKAGGKGLAKKMFEAMISHARKEHLQVLPLCTFVQAQLKRNPANYADLWTAR